MTPRQPAFVALYTGRTISDAEIVGVTTNAGAVRVIASAIRDAARHEKAGNSAIAEARMATVRQLTDHGLCHLPDCGCGCKPDLDKGVRF